MKKIYNFQRLKGRIKEYYKSQEDFAKELKLTNTALNYKLNNRTRFSYDELNLIINLLKIRDDEILDIFFTEEVSK